MPRRARVTSGNSSPTTTETAASGRSTRSRWRSIALGKAPRERGRERQAGDRVLCPSQALADDVDAAHAREPAAAGGGSVLRLYGRGRREHAGVVPRIP